MLECFKWCFFKCLNPTDHHPGRVRKVDRLSVDELDFRDMKFPVKFRAISEILKKEDGFSISVIDNKNKKKYPIYVSKKCTEEKHVVLLFIEEKSKRNYVLIKDFDTFLYDHIQLCRIKHIINN